MITRISLVLACLLLIALPASSDATDPAIPVVTAGSDTVHIGDVFAIPISITDAIELTSWQFDLSFSPSIIKANTVTEGPFLSESGTKTTLFIPGVIDNVTGHITLVADSFADLPPGPSGSGVLADIEFQALAVGISPLTLSNVFLNLSDSGFGMQNGLVTVVPEPGTLTLVSVGLGVWMARRWRSSRRTQAR
jgi:Cohesin domain